MRASCHQNNDLAGANHIKVNFALGEMRKLGIRICAQITASQSAEPDRGRHGSRRPLSNQHLRVQHPHRGHFRWQDEHAGFPDGIPAARSDCGEPDGQRLTLVLAGLPDSGSETNHPGGLRRQRTSATLQVLFTPASPVTNSPQSATAIRFNADGSVTIDFLGGPRPMWCRLRPIQARLVGAHWHEHRSHEGHLVIHRP